MSGIEDTHTYYKFQKIQYEGVHETKEQRNKRAEKEFKKQALINAQL